MQRCNILAESTTEYFKRSLTIPFLDYLLSEMKERFSVTNRQAVTSIMSLLPQIAIKCALDYKLFSFYENDLPSYSSLPSELDHWILYWRRKMETSSPPETLVNCYHTCRPRHFPKHSSSFIYWVHISSYKFRSGTFFFCSSEAQNVVEK